MALAADVVAADEGVAAAVVVVDMAAVAEREDGQTAQEQMRQEELR